VVMPASMQAFITAQISISPARTSASGRSATSFSQVSRAIDLPVSVVRATNSPAVENGCGTGRSSRGAAAPASVT